jgi:hypothetical protein
LQILGKKLIIFADDKEDKLKKYLTVKKNRVMREIRVIFEGRKSLD